MNKKAQFEEINPIGVAGGLVGGILAIVVMCQVEVGLIYKIGAFIFTSIIAYFVFNKIALQN